MSDMQTAATWLAWFIQGCPPPGRKTRLPIWLRWPDWGWRISHADGGRWVREISSRSVEAPASNGECRTWLGKLRKVEAKIESWGNMKVIRILGATSNICESGMHFVGRGSLFDGLPYLFWENELILFFSLLHLKALPTTSDVSKEWVSKPALFGLRKPQS